MQDTIHLTDKQVQQMVQLLGDIYDELHTGYIANDSNRANRRRAVLEQRISGLLGIDSLTNPKEEGK